MLDNPLAEAFGSLLQSAQTRGVTRIGQMPAARREQVSALPTSGTGVTHAGASRRIPVSVSDLERTGSTISTAQLAATTESPQTHAISSARGRRSLRTVASRV